jgi:predicted GNAT family acetyltransferase|tara:strand:+ start:1399 stop:1716 length:318 start_codon:yes stop_codon:yes gene_type:complete
MTEEALDLFVVDNTENNRFELRERSPDGNRAVSFAAYERRGSTVVIPYVETDPQRRGEGLANQLMVGVLDQIESAGGLVAPLCPFAAQHIAERPERSHLLAPIDS